MRRRVSRREQRLRMREGDGRDDRDAERAADLLRRVDQP
jgi:hypothetical protein